MGLTEKSLDCNIYPYFNSSTTVRIFQKIYDNLRYMNLCFYLSNRVDTYIYGSIYDERRYLIAMHQIKVKSNVFQVPIRTMTSHIYRMTAPRYDFSNLAYLPKQNSIFLYSSFGQSFLTKIFFIYRREDERFGLSLYHL